jgi:hypothetical protein
MMLRFLEKEPPAPGIESSIIAVLKIDPMNIYFPDM